MKCERDALAKECNNPLPFWIGRRQIVSQHNRNVRGLDTVETSGVMRLSLFLFEGFAPGVILGWTSLRLGAICLLTGGRVGLCRRSTPAPRAPVDASLAPLPLGQGFFLPAGVRRPC